MKTKEIRHQAPSEAATRDRFFTMFHTVRDPDNCHLTELYDPRYRRIIVAADDLPHCHAPAFLEANQEMPWLAAAYDPLCDSFDVISFGIDEVTANRLRISLYDIFVMSPVGMAYTVKSRGHAYTLGFDFKAQKISGDIDDLLKDGQAAGTPIERVIDQLWAMMGTSVEGLSEAA